MNKSPYTGFFTAVLSAMLAAVLSAILAAVLAAPPRAAQIALSPLPEQPAETPWPTREWPRAPIDARVDAPVDARVDAPVDARVDLEALTAISDRLMQPEALDALGRTHALVVVHRGKIVLERYDDHHGCERIGHTMSIAKFAAPAMAGVMAMDGALDLDAPARLAYWPDADDPRRQITPYHIMTMTTGLRWNDATLIGNDFLEFAFGSGIDDLAGYVASKPLDHKPGTHFYYSDGSLSLLGELLREHAGGARSDVGAYLENRLFEPLGMDRTEAELDRRGVWYGSSGMRWSPCDLARLSLFYLRDGVWEGERLLPEGWMDRMRAPTPASLVETSAMQTEYGAGYGMASFAYDVDPASRPVEADAFGHLGFGGHVLWIEPSRDVIVIIYGSRAAAHDKHARRIDAARRIAALFPPVDDMSE